MNKDANLEQISKLDNLAMEEFGLDILQMMEIAGSSFAYIVRDFLKDLKGKRILILSGVGNNEGMVYVRPDILLIGAQM
jgi:NAD(P)H-hydrate repair Nnr-like enzyme with NAD(P)H-hydrate epimerase domain